jgi:hypothetical protein
MEIALNIEFGGGKRKSFISSSGLELLFGGVKKTRIHDEWGGKRVKELILWIASNLLKDRIELFLQERTM